MAEHQDREHAVHGASGAHRWMACPGSIRMSEGMPGNTNIYAAEGTAAHQIAEICLRDGQQPDNFLGDVIPVDGFEIKIDDQFVRDVEVYVDHVRSLVRPQDGDQLYVEQQFNLDSLNAPAPMFGTADVVIWHPKQRLLRIRDLKFGRGQLVEVEGNKQQLYYALGAFLNLKLPAIKIEPGVVQPRAYHPDGPIRITEVEPDQLVDFASDLFDAVVATQAPDAPLVAGDHCTFCLAEAVCPARRQKAFDDAQVHFDEGTGAVTVPAKPEAMTPELLAKCLNAADALEDWIKAVRGYGHNIGNSGIEIPGWKLVSKRGRRQWIDKDLAIVALRSLGLTESDYMTDPELKSVAQAEKGLPKSKKDELEIVWETKANGTNLVRESSERPAVVVGSEFDDVFS